MPEPLLTRLLALIGVLTISFSAVFVRLSDAAPSTSAFFRALYALPVLIQPVATLVWGRALFDERLAFQQTAGALLVLGGVAMVQVAGAVRRRGADRRPAG